jgi:hypothetical protein
MEGGDAIGVDRASQGDFSIPMILRGAIVGVTTFVLGLLFVFLTAGSTVQQAAGVFEPLAEAGGRFVPVWKAAGWTFLDGHFVGTTYPGGSVDMVGMGSVQYVYLVPVLLLLAADGILGQLSSAIDIRAGLLSGMALVSGYLPMAVIFTALTHHGNVQPSLLRAFVVAGVVYPIGFGAVGGMMSALLRRE